MAAKTSAGLLLYRIANSRLEVLLGHNGGPFFVNKNKSAWSIPKGEFDPDSEDPLQAAQREFKEETGADAPPEPYIELGSAKYPSGKTVIAWAAKGEFDPAGHSSNTFTMEWPKGSGVTESFPEVDKVAWMTPDAADGKVVAAQFELIKRLESILTEQGDISAPPIKPDQQSLF